MKNLKSVEDFVLSAEFREWVLYPSTSTNIFWEKWLNDNPDKKENLQEAVYIVRKIARINYQPEPGFSDTIWARIKANIDQTSKEEREAIPLNVESVTKSEKRRSGSGKLGFWIGLAASLLIVAASILFISTRDLFKDKEPVAITSILKSNPKGQKSTIMLPDGTSVILNSQSSLNYTSEYDNTERRVRLKGEAFFEVEEDPEKPFIVETENLLTTALGTSFNVNAGNSEFEEITLVTGKIEIKNMEAAQQSEILIPGEMVTFEKATGLEKTLVDSFDHLAWKDGIIVFQDTPLNEAVSRLEKWYGVEIEIRNLPPDYAMKFTGSFDNDNLRNVLRSLSYTMSFEFDINKKKVVLHFKKMPMN